MTAYQLALRHSELRECELTPFDQELFYAIVAAADPRTGAVTGLLRVAEDHGLKYWYALDRLGKLELLGWVKLARTGRGKPLTIWPGWEGFRGQ